MRFRLPLRIIASVGSVPNSFKLSADKFNGISFEELLLYTPDPISAITHIDEKYSSPSADTDTKVKFSSSSPQNSYHRTIF